MVTKIWNWLDCDFVPITMVPVCLRESHRLHQTVQMLLTMLGAHLQIPLPCRKEPWTQICCSLQKMLVWNSHWCNRFVRTYISMLTKKGKDQNRQIFIAYHITDDVVVGYVVGRVVESADCGVCTSFMCVGLEQIIRPLTEPRLWYSARQVLRRMYGLMECGYTPLSFVPGSLHHAFVMHHMAVSLVRRLAKHVKTPNVR
jgi:hypothetical protein